MGDYLALQRMEENGNKAALDAIIAEIEAEKLPDNLETISEMLYKKHEAYNTALDKAIEIIRKAWSKQ